MLVFFQKYFLYFLVFGLARCYEDFYSSDSDTDELIQKMYYKYKEIIGDSETIAPIVNMRRFFDRGNAFEIHVRKLKEVDGYKRHNLMVKGRLREGDGNELVYINNPVESKIPNSFLSLNEFKQMLLERAKNNSLPFPGKDMFTSTDRPKRINYVFTFTTKKVMPTRTVHRFYGTGKSTKHENVKGKTSTVKSGKEKKKKLSSNKAVKIDKINNSSLTNFSIKSLKRATNVNKITNGSSSTTFGSIKNSAPKEKITEAITEELDTITEFTEIVEYSNEHFEIQNNSNLDSKDSKNTKNNTIDDHVSKSDKERIDLAIGSISLNNNTSNGVGQKQTTKEILATTIHETVVDLDKTALELKENETSNKTETNVEETSVKLNETIPDLNETTVDASESNETGESVDLEKYFESLEESTVATRRTRGRPMVFMGRQ